MAAVFPPTTTEPWVFNGVTYQYDADDDRWYVISSVATDEIVSDIGDLQQGTRDLNDKIDAEVENRENLIGVAVDKNNDQDAALAELDARLDTISQNIGILEFKGEYKYVLEKLMMLIEGLL